MDHAIAWNLMHGVVGDATEVPVVLAHGFTGTSGSWTPDLLEGLASTGRRVVAVDLPGHGTRWGERAPRAFTLEAALEVLGSATPGRMDLVGYSMGGRIALHFAASFPERVNRLVLESASPGLQRARARAMRRAEDEALALRLEREGVAAFMTDWSTRPVLRPGRPRPPELEEHIRSIRLANSAEGLAAALRGLGTGALPSLWKRLDAVAQPTLLLVGGQDRKFVEIARRMAEELPNASVEVVPEAGHTVHLDRPRAWLKAVRGHLGPR